MPLSREEIYDAQTMKHLGGNPNGTRMEIVLASMDEYAKQEAIGVSNYIALNKYRWLLSSQMWTSPKDDLLSPDELYQQYLNSKTNG